MERILLAIDGTNLNRQSVEFACYLAALTHSKITAVFLENLVVNERYVLEETEGQVYMNRVTDRSSDEYVKKMDRIEGHITLFKDACERRSVAYSVLRSEGNPEVDIITESRYSDLLIVDAETSFSKKFEGVPTKFVKEVLKQSECPVIVAPRSFKEIEEIILTFNGTKSSMFAIRQFSYLFPALSDTKVTVLHVEDKSPISESEKERFREWISEHYSSVSFETLSGSAESALFAQLLNKKNVLIVMGAYGRSTISRFFKKSQADLLLKVITQAFFITHY